MIDHASVRTGFACARWTVGEIEHDEALLGPAEALGSVSVILAVEAAWALFLIWATLLVGRVLFG